MLLLSLILFGWSSLIIGCYYIIRPIPSKSFRIIVIISICIFLTEKSCENLLLYEAFSILTIALCWLTSIRLVHLSGFSSERSLTIRSYLSKILWIYFPIISSNNQWSIRYDVLILVMKMLINHWIYRWSINCGSGMNGERIFLFFVSMMTISYVTDVGMIVVRIISADRYTLESYTYFPLFSLSLREFWGQRYNRIVNRIFRESIFQPIRKESGSRAMAGLTTFLISGILHAHVAYIVFGNLSDSSWALIYFLLHGIVCLFEAKVNCQLCEHVAWLLTNTFLLRTAPMMLEPFIREGSLFLQVNPPPLINYSWIPQLPQPNFCP